MIPTFWQQVIGALVRGALFILSGWLKAHGGPSFTDNQLAKAVAEATPVAVAITWSIYQKYKQRQKQLTAGALSQPASEAHVDMLVASGRAPSVMTQKHETPTLTSQQSPA